MRRVMVVGVGGWLLATCLVGGGPGVARLVGQTAVPAPPEAAAYKAMLDKYCVSCHNEQLKTGGLVLQNADLSAVPQHADTWEKVIRKLRVGMMPPQSQGSRRPDEATAHAFVSWLETNIDAAPGAKSHPGRPVLHRLNRSEYARVIRDLLALDIDPAALLPPDDSSFGFDNIADTLGVSPTLQQSYLDAAEKIAALAVGDPKQPMFQEVYKTSLLLTQTGHIEGTPLGTHGGGMWKVNLPLDGEYELKASYWATHLGIPRGLFTPHTLVITVDGAQVFAEPVGTESDQAAAKQDVSNAVAAVDARLHVRVPIAAGPHEIAVAFQKRSDALAPKVLVPFKGIAYDFAEGEGLPQIAGLRVQGPFNPTGPGDTPSRRKMFSCRPSGPKDEEACAATILKALARQAYRRPITDGDAQILMQFYGDGRQERGFESGIQMGLRRILASPEFMFRPEHDHPNLAPGVPYRISDLELASRLSFFLWSSVPDEELLTVAAKGTLHEPAVLSHQVDRMLRDPRSEALTTNFAGQWLYLRNLKSVKPDPFIYPDFDDNLREAFQRETEMLFNSVVHENRSLVDLLTADYTFVNERLAAHYGIPNIYGTEFRRVKVDDPARRGLLGQGSILTVTSLGDRTSPVKRGKWVLENLLGTPPPPPPPVVPMLPSDIGDKQPKTMRAQMELHRANPVCASCHKLMDPIGFAMDNFDGIGAWREHDRGAAIDASGTLMDGTPVDGVVSLRSALLKYQDVFVQTVTEKLMMYALGRGLDYRDMPTVRAIAHEAKANNDRFMTVLMGIVRSASFQMRVNDEPATVAKVAAR